MDPTTIVRESRRSAGLSVRQLAAAAGVAASTVHRIERGRLAPTVEMLGRLVEASGRRLVLDSEPDQTTVAGLAQLVAAGLAIDRDDRTTPVRRAAEFTAAFERAGPSRKPRMLRLEPPTTGDVRWDAFLAALAEWLAVRGRIETPAWVHDPSRYLARSWWVTPMMSLHAWEYAGSPASFQHHGVYIHRDSITNV